MTATTKAIVLDVLLKLLSCVCIGYFAVNAAGAFAADRSRITLAVAVFSEITTIVISLISRRPPGRDWEPLTVVATVYAGSLFALLISVEPGIRLLDERLCAALQIAGIVWAIIAKLALGRSFGWLPADRGIVDNGPYRIVRHPIYLGYLISHIGFLAANLNVQNLLAYTSLYVAQFYRIHREEKLLMRNEAYRNYAGRVRYRLIYGVF